MAKVAVLNRHILSIASARRGLDVLGLGHRTVAAGGAGVQGRGGLEEEVVDFLLGAGRCSVQRGMKRSSPGARRRVRSRKSMSKVPAGWT
jgi:hypothetical protein